MTTSLRSDNVGILQRAVRLPLRLIPPTTTTRVLSGPLRGCKWIVGASTHACWIGTFERQKQKMFADTLRHGDVVYDLGAHVGLYSLLAACRVGYAGHVYAFEPLPRNLAYLQQHLQLNGVKNCTVVDAAVSSKCGTAVFDESVHPAIGHLGQGRGHAINVRTVGLDELVACRAIRPPRVVKCDIEGGEYDALRGATSVLSRYRPIVFVATHYPYSHRGCCELLGQLGFDLFSLNGLTLDHPTEMLAVPR